MISKFLLVGFRDKRESAPEFCNDKKVEEHCSTLQAKFVHITRFFALLCIKDKTLSPKVSVFYSKKYS